MIHQRFSVNFFFAICLFIVLKGAEMQGQFSKVSYETEINQGELGIRMRYDSSDQNPRMNVTIYYETEAQSATDFFQQQLTSQVVNDFNQCGVVWNFMPCGTSKLDNSGVLSCSLGADQCKFDKIHACVATMSAQDQLKIGQFVICFFNNNKNVDLCLGQIGLNSGNVNACAGPQGEGANDCSAFNSKIHSPTAQTEGLGTPPSTEGTTNFKGVLCNQFAKVSVQCSAC